MTDETVQRAAIEAAVDAGSNSVHVLVASVGGHRLEPLVDESVFLGLGAAVADGGSLGQERAEALAGVLDGYANRARDLGARHVLLLGTEPLRRAADRSEVAEAVERVTGVPLLTLSHEEEAQLTAIGVTRGCPPATPTLILDVGGGSTEFIVLRPGEMPVAGGIRIGSSRLTEAAVRHDPPLRQEIETMRGLARAALVGVPPVPGAAVVAVGGTAANLARVIPGAVDGDLTPDRLERVLDDLMAEPAASFGARQALNPRRAPLLPAGAVMIEAILEWAGVNRLRALDVGVREGAVLAVSRAGEAWRARLPELVRGWD